MHLAKYWKKNKEIQCRLCPRECRIPEDKTGFCKVRKNIDGKLYSLVYAKPVAINVDPIEKKPFYHFNPGSRVLSIGTLGCNFRCAYCCNHDISQAAIEAVKVEEVSPEQIIRLAKSYKAQGIAYTYNEPTIFFEYALDTAKLAKKAGLFNVFVTNGYSMEKPLKDISPYLDAVVIDFKGNNPDFYKKHAFAELEKVKAGALRYRKFTKAFIEFTNLVVPGLNDSLKEIESLAKWIKTNFGKQTPLHLIRFFPTYKMMDIPQTPVQILESMYSIAKEYLDFVYIGNIPDHEYNSTYCPGCEELLIKRVGFNIEKHAIKNGKCEKCSLKINMSGQFYA